MIFTKIGWIVAWVIIVLGIFGIGFHFYIVGYDLGISNLLEEGFFIAILGVALGILVEISHSVAQKNLEKSKS
jgi:uncharacterized membrane protein YiaA